MKKLWIIAIIIILLSEMLYGSSDNLTINDSTQTIPEKIKDTRHEKGAFGFSSGKVLGTGWTVRIRVKKFSIQGTALVAPTATTETGNNYNFGLTCSYDLVNIPYFRMYLSTGTSYYMSCHDDRKWYVGLAPMIDFSIPPFESISFNIGYSASYVSEHWNQEHEYTFKYSPEVGFYYRIF